MKFRKKPIIVEAEKFYQSEPMKGVNCEIENFLGFPIQKFYIQTLEGKMEVKNGDWVITGVEGEMYPCKPSIFEATYEAVEE